MLFVSYFLHETPYNRITFPIYGYFIAHLLYWLYLAMIVFACTIVRVFIAVLLGFVRKLSVNLSECWYMRCNRLV